jgi:predicted enzyme involved in methoxymalonyl-ACP biosynthesis
MSCRAFSRRIEHRCVAQLFQRFDAEHITFDFMPTAKNGPMRDFLAGLLDAPASPNANLNRESFAAKCPKLYQRVKRKSWII